MSSERYGAPDLERETEGMREHPRWSRHTFRRCPEVSWTDASGRHVHTVEHRSVIGSSPNADVVVTDPSVSRIHAELELRDDGVWVRDFGSRNGTFVEGILIASARLPETATIRVGSTAIDVRDRKTPTAIDLWPEDRFGPLVGGSILMRELFARMARVAALQSTVLITGETGTGKELVARALHEASARARQPFVIVDCAALPENLLEAELFGHVKGAFTGATVGRAGAIESADGGTVLLDEIGELPLSMQPKLLRVLESRTIRRVGESNHRQVDVRFLSATHRDLHTMVNDGAFREDLYFRLTALPLRVPPLRERRDDIPALVADLLPSSSGGLAHPELLREAMSRPWLGNVRELKNFLERAVAFGAREALAMAPAEAPRVRGGATAGDHLEPLNRPFKVIRDEWLHFIEREYLQAMLERHNRNITALALEAGLDRSYVHRLIRKHNL